jgi:hypothetical protein
MCRQHRKRRTLHEDLRARFLLMNALDVFIGLLIGLLVIALLYTTRKLKTRRGAFGTQSMCPACGSITSRLKTCCLECGKLLPAVVV